MKSKYFLIIGIILILINRVHSFEGGEGGGGHAEGGEGEGGHFGGGEEDGGGRASNGDSTGFDDNGNYLYNGYYVSSRTWNNHYVYYIWLHGVEHNITQVCLVNQTTPVITSDLIAARNAMVYLFQTYDSNQNSSEYLNDANRTEQLKIILQTMNTLSTMFVTSSAAVIGISYFVLFAAVNVAILVIV
ncbi:MAG: hypothetical protein Terrestrivirus5_96 [Terrestrivirus sp.]|uniref:Uncharacterized protein n=1 Tax=Terrestrivirus sp. TaxID=2487775 RepID=A0A3G4ZPE1_9VIRU|nr:MAG: hypothetical protein Terrestrivirus5_96 [Terrestrivirus sp.]